MYYIVRAVQHAVPQRRSFARPWAGVRKKEVCSAWPPLRVFVFHDLGRMNVAITRAKELLVVIGNASILQQDPFWRSFLQFALRNRLWVGFPLRACWLTVAVFSYAGPPLELELDGNYISRLE